MPRVTVVNDNPEFLALVDDLLKMEDYETTLVDGDRGEALDRIRASRPDVLMIDLRLGSEGLHGWDIAQEVRADPELRGTPILICSADTMALDMLHEEFEGARDVAELTKPFDIDDLYAAIEGLLEPTTPT